MKLNKISGGLYEEETNGGSIRWTRGFELVCFHLTEVSYAEGEAVETAGVSYHDKDTRKSIKNIYAKGKLEPNRVIEVTNEGDEKFQHFTSADINLRSVTDWESQPLEVRKGSMWLVHGDLLNYGYEHRSPHLDIEVPIPDSLFRELADNIKNKCALKTVALALRVALYRSELERSLSEPWQYRQLGIDKSEMSDAVISSLTIQNSPIAIGHFASDQEVPDEDEPQVSHHAVGTASPAPIEVQSLVDALGRTQRSLHWIAVMLGLIAIAVFTRY